MDDTCPMTAPLSVHPFSRSPLLPALARAWDLPADSGRADRRLRLPAKRGWVEEHRFANGTRLVLFRGKLPGGLRLRWKTDRRTPILFWYHIRGAMTLHLDGRDQPGRLDELDAALMAPYGVSAVEAAWPDGQEAHWALVVIERKRFQEHLEAAVLSMPLRLGQLFRGGEDRRHFLFQQHYGVPISRVLRDMMQSRLRPGLRETYLEAKTLELLSLQFARYLDASAPGKRRVDLKPYDLRAILQARDHIEDSLREPPTIPELARHVGINVNKLKRGFKSVFNTTINRYTTARRLEWAHRLLQEEALSVGEVVDRIGYENRSYFARIFRDRYGMHPGEVRQHLQSVVSDAS